MTVLKGYGWVIIASVVTLAVAVVGVVTGIFALAIAAAVIFAGLNTWVLINNQKRSRK